MTKKHYIGIFFTVVLAVFLTISVMAFIASTAPKGEPKEQVETIVKPTKYDIVLECQKLSAMTQNKDWGYATCVKELEDANNNGVKIQLN